MNTLIIGKGGREHALAMACQEASNDLFFTDANAGMEQIGTNLALETVDDAPGLASDLRVDLAIIGPEGFLASGVADALRHHSVPTLGFGAEAARLESSKIFANEFMEEYDILKPATMVANTPEDGLLFVRGHKAENYVIKADGLAGGKGVILPKSKRQARDKLIAMMSGESFGAAGERVLFQERLHGQEVSMMALFDGSNAEVLFLAQDFKRLKDKDKGPNTGGMGSYAPVTPEVADEWQVDQMYGVLEKTLYGLKQRGIADPGVIYIGFMLAEEFGGDPAVMEYNVRFGDPETQAGLTLLQDAGVDVHELLQRAALGDLGIAGSGEINTTRQSGRAALTVCLAAPGYPEAPKKGEPIYGLDYDVPGVTVHHGATRSEQGHRTLTDGGRVLYVTGVGDSLKEAASIAYGAIGEEGIIFSEMQLREDIGRRAIKAAKKAR